MLKDQILLIIKPLSLISTFIPAGRVRYMLGYLMIDANQSYEPTLR
jgi:hypothetical protein